MNEDSRQNPTAGAVQVERIVRCPRCGKTVRWQGNAHRPFCGSRCRDIDLGAWASERFRIAGPPVPDDGGFSSDA